MKNNITLFLCIRFISVSQITVKQTTMTNLVEHIFCYNDGSVYMGHMVDGKRHGRGTLRTAAFVYADIATYTHADAVENAHRAKWHEYIGEWANDKLHGHGLHLWKSGDGGEITVFQGEWKNGQPQRRRRESFDSDDDSRESASEQTGGGVMDAEMETNVFGY